MPNQDVLIQPETLDHPLSSGCPPSWASGWGDDEFGPWVEISVKRVTQRLRWIPPGKFYYGSPKGEEGRFDWEALQQEKMVRQVFWIFDTPCTQAMWEAVMANNPSHFKGANRPVETVSWDDCQQFVKKLNEIIVGLNVSLPTEEQWECACRAGSDRPRYSEDLDSIAWYDKNSKAETHEVALKKPNAWGLYDMLGNVWEWCDSRFKPDDAKDETLANRVIRGGAWYDPAGYARAACRHARHQGYRDDGLGFRCSSSESEPEKSRRQPETERSPAAASVRRRES